jgi:hypothetical protein
LQPCDLGVQYLIGDQYTKALHAELIARQYAMSELQRLKVLLAVLKDVCDPKFAPIVAASWKRAGLDRGRVTPRTLSPSVFDIGARFRVDLPRANNELLEQLFSNEHLIQAVGSPVRVVLHRADRRAATLDAVRDVMAAHDQHRVADASFTFYEYVLRRFPKAAAVRRLGFTAGTVARVMREHGGLLSAPLHATADDDRLDDVLDLSTQCGHGAAHRVSTAMGLVFFATSTHAQLVRIERERAQKAQQQADARRQQDEQLAAERDVLGVLQQHRYAVVDGAPRLLTGEQLKAFLRGQASGKGRLSGNREQSLEHVRTLMRAAAVPGGLAIMPYVECWACSKQHNASTKQERYQRCVTLVGCTAAMCAACVATQGMSAHDASHSVPRCFGTKTAAETTTSVALSTSASMPPPSSVPARRGRPPRVSLPTPSTLAPSTPSANVPVTAPATAPAALFDTRDTEALLRQCEELWPTSRAVSQSVVSSQLQSQQQSVGSDTDCDTFSTAAFIRSSARDIIDVPPDDDEPLVRNGLGKRSYVSMTTIDASFVSQGDYGDDVNVDDDDGCISSTGSARKFQRLY